MTRSSGEALPSGEARPRSDARHDDDAAGGPDALVERTHGLLRVVGRLAGGSLSSHDIGTGHDELDTALAWAEHFLRTRGPGLASTEDVEGPRVARELLLETVDLRHRLLVGLMASREEMMQRLDLSLRNLRRADSVDELVERLPQEVVSLGYVRSLFSWAEQGVRWVAHSAHSVKGPAESRQLVEAGRLKPYRDLRNFFEYEMIRERRPILLHGINKSAHVHPELIKITDSESYVAAPVTVDGVAVGFTSLDVNATTGTVDEFDRDLVGLLTSGAGIAMERMALRAANQSAEAGTGAPLQDRRLEALRLTRREGEILRLVAGGLTNAEIAAELFISEGTAKTHVRNVLRKLEAGNRTEAAAIYRQVTSTRRARW